MTTLVIPPEKTRLSGVKKCSKMACRLLDKSSAEELIHTTDNFLFDCDGTYEYTTFIKEIRMHCYP